MFNKIINYIKNNKFYLIVMVLGTIGFLLQMKYVVLYADDLYLGITAKKGLKAAISLLFSNYVEWGGGPTPTIATIFLMMPIKVWKLLNCAMIVITIILSTRMITHKLKVNKGIIASCMWMLIYVLNSAISVQTLYWLDGNLAYVLTAFQMFIYFYYLYSRIIMKINPKKYDYVIIPLFAFFAGWSGPQAGAITVIIPILLFAWVRFINKEKIKPIYIISWIIGLAGFLVYYLAPGNNMRSMQSFPEFTNYNIIEKLLYRADCVWNLMFNFEIYRFASIPFYLYIAIGFMSAIALKKATEENNKKIAITMNVFSKCIIVFLVLNLAISMKCNIFEVLSGDLLSFKPLLENLANGTFSMKMLVPYITTGLILMMSMVLSYYVAYKEKNPLLCILYVSALLGQAMMMLAPYSPLRTTFITVILLWATIACLLSVIVKENVSIIAIFSLILAMTYDIKIVVILLFLYFILKNGYDLKNKENTKTELILIGVLFLIITLNIYWKTTNGYRKNEIVYNENIERIESFRENPTEDNILYLKRAADPTYQFDEFVGTPWIEKAVKNYFELDEDVVLKYEDGGMNE